MARIKIVGGGMVGSTIARQLSPENQVEVLENNPLAFENLNQSGLNAIKGDATDENVLGSFLEGADLVIGAMPGFLGYQVLQQLIENRQNVVDISFFPEDPFNLQALAVEKGVTVIVDAGVAPGLCNLMLGAELNKQEVTSYRCFVGGLPVRRVWPWQYKAVFSPSDVIEEYIRPVTVRAEGKNLTKSPLSEPELVDFEQVGTLEAFLTDGLRTLLTTTKVPNLVEKTLRYPGTADYLRMLAKSGFFDSRTNSRFGISPLEFTSEILKNQWKLEEHEPDLTLMQVEITGRNYDITYQLFDQYDSQNQVLSMSRCTGFTCVAIAEQVLAGKFQKKGVFAPEQIGGIPGILDNILEYLKQRKIEISYATT